VAIDDSSFGQVVGRHLEIDPITRENTNSVPAQTPGNVCEDDVSVIELDRKGRAGEDLLDAPGDLEGGFLDVLGRRFGFGGTGAGSTASVARGYGKYSLKSAS
jgi:hypothetical protein